MSEGESTHNDNELFQDWLGLYYFMLYSNETIKDAHGKKLKIYPEVIQVLEILKANKILVAAASRTHAPPAAQEMLNKFDLDKYFDFKEIYPGEKTTHFQK